MNYEVNQYSYNYISSYNFGIEVVAVFLLCAHSCVPSVASEQSSSRGIFFISWRYTQGRVPVLGYIAPTGHRKKKNLSASSRRAEVI